MKKIYVFVLFLIVSVFLTDAQVVSSPMTTNHTVGTPSISQVPYYDGSKWEFESIDNGTTTTNLQSGYGISITSHGSTNIIAISNNAAMSFPNTSVGWASNANLTLTVHPPVTGLVMWIDPALLSATNGQALTTVSDTSGFGNDLLNGTANNVLYAAAGINGRPAISFPANWNLSSGAAPAKPYALTNGVFTSLTTGFTLTIVFRDILEKGGSRDTSPVLAGQPALFGYGTDFNFKVFPFTTESDGSASGSLLVPGLNPNDPLMLPLEENYGENVLTIRAISGTSASDVWLNGVRVRPGANTTRSVSGSLFTVGSAFSSGSIQASNSFCGFIGDIVASTNVESDAEVQVLQNYELAKYARNKTTLTVLDGDSIMLGYESAAKQNLTAMLHLAIPTIRIVCPAVSGASSSNQLSRMSNWVSTVPAGSAIVEMWGANDEGLGFTLATVETNFLLAANLARSQGINFIACTMPSLQWETNATSLFTPTQLNTWIYANSTVFSAVCDFAANPNMGPAGSYTNKTYFYDGIHWTAAGYKEEMNQFLIPIVTTVLFSIPSPVNTPGVNNVFVSAGNLSVTGIKNVGIGQLALQLVNSGYQNIGIGYKAMTKLTTGIANLSIGNDSLEVLTNGIGNVNLGVFGENGMTNGGYNTSIGYGTLYSLLSGNYNTALGYNAGFSLPDGDKNIFIGFDAGFSINVAATNDIDIANNGVAGDQGVIRIGTPGTHTNTYIAGIIHSDGMTNGIVMGATTATTNLCKITTPAGATNIWSVGGNVGITAAVTDTAKMVVLFTDETDTIQSNSISPVLTGTGNNNVASSSFQAYPSTPIYLVVTLPTSSGSITYNAAGFIKIQ